MPRSSSKVRKPKKPITTLGSQPPSSSVASSSAPVSREPSVSASGKEATATTSPATSSSKKKLGETRKQRKKRQAEEAEAKAAADSEEKASGAAERVDAGGETDVEEVERELGGRERSGQEPIAAGPTQAAELNQDFVRFDDDDDASSSSSSSQSVERAHSSNSKRADVRAGKRKATDEDAMSECPHCEDYGHEADSCPLFWRRYSYLSTSERDAELARRESLVAAGGWQQQAFGAVYKLGGGAWCYECARQGHYGDDCPQRSRRLKEGDVTPSAFSASIGLSSPFASAYPPGWEPQSIYHSKDGVDALPFAESQPEFHVGAKGKQKAMERQRAAAAAAGMRDDEDDDDEEDWFDRRHQRKATQGKQQQQRQGPGQALGTPAGTPKAGGAAGAFKPFSPTVRLHQSSAQVGKGNNSGRSNGGGGGGGGFYGSGQGGGNVSNWGRDYDRYERNTQQSGRDGGARYGSGSGQQQQQQQRRGPTYRGGY